MCESSVPVSVLKLELDEPVIGWSRWLADRDVEVVLDDLGRQAVAADDARRLIAERNEDERRRAEESARRIAEAAARQQPVQGGVPSIPGLTALQSMAVASGADERAKTRAGDRMLAFMRGESSGATFAFREEEG